MAKPTAKIQITIETLQRTVIRKRNFRTTAETGVFELLQLQDDVASVHLPPKSEKQTDTTILESEMEN